MDSISEPDWSKIASLDAELVRAFVVVAESGGFTAAARQLHRTQSTISLRIRTLEERLGAHLFMRNSRHFALSSDGENFLIHARRILQVQNEAIASLTRGSRGNVIRFGLPEDYAELWLPELLRAFYALRPGARPHIHCRTSLELLERLGAGELDLALVVRHGERAGGKPLARQELVWAAHRDFVLPTDAPVPLALFDESCTYRQRGLQALTAIGRDYQLVYTSQSPTGIRIAVNHGAAVTIIDRRTLPACWRTFGETDGLPALPPAELELHIAPTMRNEATRDLSALIETLVSEHSGVMA
jgi:DNA-binding transcriptional LysR family regulator